MDEKLEKWARIVETATPQIAVFDLPFPDRVLMMVSHLMPSTPIEPELRKGEMALALSELSDADRFPIKNCARCGEDHEPMPYLPLRTPDVDVRGDGATHYTLCPTNQQPVLMAVVDMDGGVYPGEYA